MAPRLLGIVLGVVLCGACEKHLDCGRSCGKYVRGRGRPSRARIAPSDGRISRFRLGGPAPDRCTR
ncbi:hypothetical protein M885DRAFT_510631 [Pelagophyceae sp. CCMP2097]|nr:hypothetical protein M885DRAFT_510631 [Pelagophyceae sp. CCMP2097]